MHTKLAMKLEDDLKNKGFSLIEVMIAVSLLTLVMLAATTFFAQQLKANNFLEFQSKREQMRLAMLGQVLNNPANCKCLFSGAANFPATAAAGNPVNLSGFTDPVAVGKFEPADCSGGSPAPLVNQTGFDGMKLISTSLNNISFGGGTYGGDLLITLESTKEVAGPKTLLLKIPVAVLTSDAGGGQRKFEGCATSSGFGISNPIIPNWPTSLNCGGTIWTVYKEGKYHCYGGPENSTRTEVMTFSLTSRMKIGIDGDTEGRCVCGECCNKSIDELIAAGLAR